MRSALPVLVLLVGAACSDDPLSRPRADAGLGPGDAGIEQPLELEAGMTFTYRAILTYRESSVAESNSQYTMTLRIASVEDRGPGESSLIYELQSWTQDIDDWSDTRDFDSWIGRLGPSLPLDDPRQGATATVDLSAPPAIPPAPTSAGKALPVPGTFFLDLRSVDALRVAFADLHPAQNPQALDPAMNGGFYRFAFSGPDPSVFYYPMRAKLRSIALDYNTKGFLRRLEETIGDTSDPPAATSRIELTAGP